MDRSIFWNVNPNNPKQHFQRNQTKYWESSVDTSVVFLHKMNLYGFRDEEWKIEKPIGKQRGLFIGDSFVEGAMANQGETIPQGFKNFAGDRFEVMNAGMVGQGLTVYLQLVADLIPLFKPDVAVLCIYANDLGQNEPLVPQYFLEPEHYSVLRPRLIEVIDQLNDSNPLMVRWSNSPQAFLPPVPLLTNPWTLNEETLKDRVTKKLAAEMISGAFNPARTNGLFVEEFHLKRIPKIGETIPFFKYICAQHEVEPLVVYIPSRNQVTDHYLKYEKELCLVACNDSMNLTSQAYQLHQKVLAKQCLDFNINFLDLTSDIAVKEAANTRLYWNYDEHMRGNGYLFLGETIWQKWGSSLLK